MGRMVILRHAMGEEDVHFDLLLERESGAERRAITFRLEQPLDLTGVAAFDAERIRDHRAVYFQYEGPVPAPGGRGTPGEEGQVTRVLAGRCEIHVSTPDLLDVTIEIAGRHARFVGERVRGGGHDGLGAWRFNRG